MVLEAKKKIEEEIKILQKELTTELPRALKTAVAMGDLRENAEYKAAKERQDLLNSSAAKMKDEMERAQIIRADEVDHSAVAFGTKVCLKADDGSTEEFVLLGPWESDPDNGIISYLSPFGSELMNRKSGEQLAFVINEREYAYKVEEIAVADFA